MFKTPGTQLGRGRFMHMKRHGAKSGQPPGKTEPLPPEQKQGRKTDVAEEDIFGGAERVHKGEPVKSETAKP